jgi:hypothetical protein
MSLFPSTILSTLALASFTVCAFGQAIPPDSTQAAPAAVSSQLSAQNTPPEADPLPANAPPMSRQTHFEIIKDFETQLVYSRTVFPMGTKGIQLKDGVITPHGDQLQTALAIWGPAVKPGDPAHISFIQIKGDHIHFEINGGPVHRQKWYQHIQVSGAGGTTQAPQNNPQTNSHGSFVDVYFAKYVPEMTAQQLRNILYPVFDFKAPNKEAAYLDTLPPKVKEAIQAHHVLVGMNEEMVIHAKGKPPKKVRERDGETAYEEWIYGELPADVDFVRIVGDEVVRVETMKVDGQKIVRTDKEVVLPDKEKDKEAKQQQEDRPSRPPSLRRPGENSDDVPKPDEGASPLPAKPPPDTTDPPSTADPRTGPGEILNTR